jgi:hypothetical protein
VQPYATIDPERHRWMPWGPARPEEAKLGETPVFLTQEQRENVTAWWLARRQRANTPNWDIAATATIEGCEGLVLVEAKAHDRELDVRGKNGKGNPENHARITAAIAEANAGLNAALPGWNLTARSHYQLANRFAWAWKLAGMRVPVILVYLGFPRAEEMVDCGRPFADADAWRHHFENHSRGTVPVECWERRLEINGTALIPLVRSAEVNLA